ncbi:MAG: LysM peptidoglycan-binding domain-containing protein [Caulobacteraceae bacterium]
MKIHVVKSGDTLWNIASLYKVNMQQIVTVNNLENPDILVIGQALIIPTDGDIHIVRAGETLWTIARRYGVTIRDILNENNISNPDLIYPGTTLRIPKPTIETNGYITLTTGGASSTVRGVGKYLTYVSSFSYEVRSDGSLPAISEGPILDTARSERATPIMTITNFQGGRFNSELAHAILSSTGVQDRLLTNVVTVIKEKGYKGLNIDFEYIPPADRELYNSFVRRAAGRMHANGFSISTALAPKIRADQPGLLYEAHDYPVHGQIADFVVLMTYEWGWSGGAPWAIAPINEVKRVLNYAVTAIPRSKILMGIPLYAYDWKLPYVKGTTFAEIFTPDEAVRRAARYKTEIKFNELYKSPYYNYKDENGVEHEVWFEDARSYQAKYNTIKEYRLRGASYWELNLGSTQNWPVLESVFRVRKL